MVIDFYFTKEEIMPHIKTTEEPKMNRHSKETNPAVTPISSPKEITITAKKRKGVSRSHIKDKKATKPVRKASRVSQKKPSRKAINQTGKRKEKEPMILSSYLTKDLTRPFALSEYYDLPYFYGQTVVKILAQTPNTLFVYWDISEKDREKFKQEFGENVFSETKPVLIVKNLIKDYAFEIEVNDFANCWYFHVDDAKCKYHIEFGRRPISSQVHLPNDYLYVSSSNVIEAPNDHVLLEQLPPVICFRNVKNNHVSYKEVHRTPNLIGQIQSYDVASFYQEAYHDEDFTTATQWMGHSSSSFK